MTYSNAISSAIKSERDDIHFEHKVVRNPLLCNGFFLKNKKNTADFTKLKFQINRKKWTQNVFVDNLSFCEKIVILKQIFD